MDDDSIHEFRHGYGIQYWTDGAHYEGRVDAKVVYEQVRDLTRQNLASDPV